VPPPALSCRLRGRYSLLLLRGLSGLGVVSPKGGDDEEEDRIGDNANNDQDDHRQHLKKIYHTLSLLLAPREEPSYLTTFLIECQ